MNGFTQKRLPHHLWLHCLVRLENFFVNAYDKDTLTICFVRQIPTRFFFWLVGRNKNKRKVICLCQSEKETVTGLFSTIIEEKNKLKSNFFLVWHNFSISEDSSNKEYGESTLIAAYFTF